MESVSNYAGTAGFDHCYDLFIRRKMPQLIQGAAAIGVIRMQSYTKRTEKIVKQIFLIYSQLKV